MGTRRVIYTWNVWEPKLYFYPSDGGYLLLLRKKMTLCFRNTTLFSSGRGSFLPLSAAGQAGGTPIHHGASVGPGQAPWRVFWASIVAKSGK